MVFVLDTAQDAFNIILQVGAGTGLLYLLRWFWWRDHGVVRNRRDGQFVRNLGCSSSATHKVFLLGTHQELLITVAFTTMCWLIMALLRVRKRTPDADRFLQEGAPVRSGLAPDP